MEHKLPPQNIEAEQSILGGLMLEHEAWDQVADRVTEDDFYRPSHQKIFLAIRDLHRVGQPTDLITVSNQLMAKKQLDEVGGPSYLAELTDQTPSTAHIESYAKIVHEKGLLRKIINMSNRFIEKSFTNDFVDVSSFLDSVESDVFKLAEERTTQGLTDASDLVKASLEKLEQLYAQKGAITGVPSGFEGIDDMTAGFQSGEMTVIAARPSMGKTALSLNIALHAALHKKAHVAYFSVEMAKEQLMMRMLANHAKVPLSALRVGQINDKDWPRLINAAAAMSEAPIFIDDTSGISPFEIRAKARRLKSKHGLDLIMVDYLQLMTLKQKVDNREREVSEISRLLKAIAKELQVPVIALAQLNRGVEGRSDRRPMLSDLRESGSIEQDADIIMMLYREDYYDRDNPDIKGLAEVIIAKQRNGPTGAVKLRWRPEMGVFANFIDAGPNPPMEPTASPAGSGTKPKAPGAPFRGKPKNLAPTF